LKPSNIYAIATGVLTFAGLLTLNALHIAEHSVWRAGIVAGISAALCFWIGPKLLRAKAS
jgi:MFS-type transporter involved in bile tolerance (Atg22 family)